MLKKRILSAILCLVMICSVLMTTACSNNVPDNDTEEITESETNQTEKPAEDADGEDSVVILYENDVHCSVEGYAKIAAMKKELAASFDHAGVVSSGDFIQGGTLGAISRGEYIVDIINEIGYDAIALGNHEFDYKMERLNELCAKLNTKVLSCNMYKIGEEKPCFDPYTIVTYGDVKIAYIGITTPETLTKSSPAQFMNDKGELIYTFNESALGEMVQKNIDAVKAEGADYVILLSHIGYCETDEFSDIVDVVANTDGLDAVLDGHSHSVIPEMIVKDKSGDDVVLSSTGTKFEYIGKLTIVDGKIDTELVKTEDYAKVDEDVKACIDEINKNYAVLGERKIAVSEVDLITHDADGNRLVRLAETNLGNLCSDSFREVLDVDIAYLNGGGIRAEIKAGDVTFNDIYSVFPFNNQMVVSEISGQTILDMLEMAMMNYPSENGSFPHVSGMTFSVNTSIPTSVKLDSNGFFIGVEGGRRVYDVMVFDKASGTYKPLDAEAKYTIAATNYFLIDLGSGMSMLANTKVLQNEGVLEIDVLEKYIVENLGGVIDERYAEVDNRITFTNGYANAVAEELMAA